MGLPVAVSGFDSLVYPVGSERPLPATLPIVSAANAALGAPPV